MSLSARGRWVKGRFVSGLKEKTSRFVSGLKEKTSSGMQQVGLMQDKLDKVKNKLGKVVVSNRFGKVRKAKKKIGGPRVRGAKARGSSEIKEKYSSGWKATAMKAARKVMKAVMKKAGAMMKAMKAKRVSLSARGRWAMVRVFS